MKYDWNQGFRWDWFWGIISAVAIAAALYAWFGSMGFASLHYAEGECYRSAIDKGLELSEDEARSADWQAYYREVRDGCQLLDVQPSEGAATFMLNAATDLAPPSPLLEHDVFQALEATVKAGWIPDMTDSCTEQGLGSRAYCQREYETIYANRIRPVMMDTATECLLRGGRNGDCMTAALKAGGDAMNELAEEASQ